MAWQIYRQSKHTVASKTLCKSISVVPSSSSEKSTVALMDIQISKTPDKSLSTWCHTFSNIAHFIITKKQWCLDGCTEKQNYANHHQFDATHFQIWPTSSPEKKQWCFDWCIDNKIKCCKSNPRQITVSLMLHTFKRCPISSPKRKAQMP